MPDFEEVQYRYTPGELQFLLYRYLLENTGKGHVVTRKQILEYLATFGITIERKTLYTDFEVIRATMKLEVEYDQSKKGYYVANPAFEPYELRLMVDSVQSSRFITQVKAKEITDKIKGLTDRYTRQTLNRQAYVPDRIRSMNDSVVKEADRLHEAIAANSKVSFRYFHYSARKEKNYSNKGQRITVSPYALSWNNGYYYLYAFDGAKFRYYRVDRMESISKPLKIEREGKEQFDAKNLTRQKAKIFNSYSGKAYTVNMRFRNELADAVIDQFGKDVMMIPVDEGHFSISVPVEISPPFFAWVASFGRRAKITGPAAVIEEMRKFIERVSDMYKDDGNT